MYVSVIESIKTTTITTNILRWFLIRWSIKMHHKATPNESCSATLAISESQVVLKDI